MDRFHHTISVADIQGGDIPPPLSLQYTCSHKLYIYSHSMPSKTNNHIFLNFSTGQHTMSCPGESQDLCWKVYRKCCPVLTSGTYQISYTYSTGEIRPSCPAFIFLSSIAWLHSVPFSLIPPPPPPPPRLSRNPGNPGSTPGYTIEPTSMTL